MKKIGGRMPLSPGEITILLSDLRNPEAISQLMRLVYKDFHRIAASKCRRERPGSSLQPTALVNEAYIRLMADGAAFKNKNRSYFFGAAAKAVHRAYIDQIRRRKADKRGGKLQRVEFDDNSIIDTRSPDGWLALDQALTDLETTDRRLRAIVELRIWGGFTALETAEILGLTEITVRRRWETAQQWLRAEITKYLDVDPAKLEHN
jgi:RNA polymerase sigma factor (TIGR02999 family)